MCLLMCAARDCFISTIIVAFIPSPFVYFKKFPFLTSFLSITYIYCAFLDFFGQIINPSIRNLNINKLQIKLFISEHS